MNEGNMTLTISTMLAMMLSATAGVTGPRLTIHAVPTAASYETTKMTSSIVAPDGQPISEAMVAIYTDGDVTPLAKTRSDENGNFSITMPPAAGSYTIHILRVGFSPVVLPLTRQGNSWSVPAQITMRPIAN
jgi:hypothetical protein